MTTSGPPRRRRLRASLGITAALALVASLAACTSEPEPGEIVVLVAKDDSVGGQRQLLIDQWNRFNPDRPARIKELSGRADQQHSSLLVDAQSPSSEVDVYGLDVTWTTEFARGGYIDPLDPLDDEDRDDFLRGPLATATVDGDLYGLPYNTDAGLLYYRKNLLPRPPTSWSELADAAETLRTRPDPRPSAVYATQLAPYEGLVVNVLETLRSAEPDKPDLLDVGLPALQRAVDQLRPHLEDLPPVTLPDSLNNDEDASLEAFRQGRVAVLRDWPVAARTLLTPSPEDPTGPQNIGVTQLFANGSILGGQNLAIARHSDQPVAARQLVQFLTNSPSQTQLFDDGGVAPTRASAYARSVRSGQEINKLIENAVANAVPRPSGACYGAFSALFSTRVHTSLVSGGPLPPDLLTELRRALDCKPVQ